MIIVYILTAIIAAVAIYWTVRNNSRSDDLDEREKELEKNKEELDKYAALLDETRKGLTEDLEDVTSKLATLKLEKAAFKDADMFAVSYAVTDSDRLRYNTERAIISNAKNRMAMTIAHDIVKKYSPKEARTEQGEILLAYHFKIIEL